MLASIIENVTKLDKIPAETGREYESIAHLLVSDVNRQLTSRADLAQLLGKNPLAIMEMNHAHHARFMTTVFTTGSYELLARTIPWVYRVYHAKGFSHDYFMVELSAWIAAIREMMAPCHTVPLIAVYQWMMANHEHMIDLSRSVDSLSFNLPEESTEMQQIFLALLLHGDHKGCLKLAEQSVNSVATLKHFYQSVISSSLYMVGDLWEKNETSVAEEHLATAIAGRVMAVVYARVAPLAEPDKGKIIVTAAPNEYHEVGARMVADFFELDGWDVTYLGANTPLDELVRMVSQQQPFVVAISATVMFSLDQAGNAIAAIKGNPALASVKVLAGGIAFNAVPTIWRTLGADGYGECCVSAVECANKWWVERV